MMTETPTIPLDDLLACAVEAATQATGHAVANRHRRHEVAAAFDHDLKLDLDSECQTRAEGVIRAAFPDHAVLAEEDLDDAGTSPYRWIVDPIDGTVNFSHGLPLWCCAVAAQHKGETVAGCVLGPDVDQCFTATVAAPAACNGTPISVSDVARLDRAMITTGLDDLTVRGYRRRELLARLAQSAQKVRIMGCAALDMCRVALGQVDGYFEAGVYDWDVEAAGLVTRQAGGKAEVLRRLDLPHQVSYVASNGQIHDALRERVMAPPAAPTDSTTAPKGPPAAATAG